MVAITHKPHAPLSKVRRKEAIEFRLLYGAAFLVFLVAAGLSRLAPGAQGRARRSILGEARAAANTCLPFAFMR
jgi:hypothetical protein